ncbi:hypothetical protein Aduo_010728 [Ancylostoma duodenale]
MKLCVLLIIIHLALCERLTTQENEELKRTCGEYTLNQRDRYKSFGGRNVAPNEFPWLAKIFTRRGNDNVLCSGVQISSRHILTAAHCVMVSNEDVVQIQCVDSKERRKFERDFLPIQNFSVYVGTRCNFPESCMQRHEAAKTWAHKMWDECDLSHDVGVIELKDDVATTESSPICMPERNSKIAKLLHSAGSGMDITITDGNKYARGIQVVNLKLKTLDRTLAMIITKGQNSAMCGGDSGGPLFQFNDRGQYIVVGIVSGAMVDCGEKKFANENFFANIRLHLKWICKRTGVCPIRGRASAAHAMAGTAPIAPIVQSTYQNTRSWYTRSHEGQGFDNINDFNQQSNWNYLDDQNNNGIYANQVYDGIYYSNPWNSPYYVNQQSYPDNHVLNTIVY